MINQLDLTVGYQSGKSYLKDMYFTPPFKIADISKYNSQNALFLMLMSSSPGILDNDEYQIKIQLEENAALRLQTQSYQRLFKMKYGASQTLDIRMDSGSTMSYMQHPTVPHKDSIFETITNINLKDKNTLTYSDIVTCGRKHSGEIFQFNKYKNRTEIYIHNKLIVKDNLYLEPLVMQLDTLGMLEQYTHQGTWIHIQTDPGDFQSKMDIVNSMLEKEEGILYGLSQPDNWGFVVRVLGYEGEQIYSVFKQMDECVNNFNLK